MKNTLNISVNIPLEMAKTLDKVAKFEERSKSYYIKKGLARILEEKIVDIKDYLEVRKDHKKFCDKTNMGEYSIYVRDLPKDL